MAKPIRSATQIWVMTRHQYGISAFAPQKPFHRETSDSIVKCQLFFQATGSYVPRHLDIDEYHVEANRVIFKKKTFCIVVPLLLSSALFSSLRTTLLCGDLEWAKACCKASPHQTPLPLMRCTHRPWKYLFHTIYGFSGLSEIFIWFKLVCMVTKQVT